MARVDEVEHLRRGHEPRLRFAVVGELRRAQLFGEYGLGEGQVDLRQRLDVDADGEGGPPDEGAEPLEDALDLALLVGLGLSPVVAEVDRRHWLDEDGRAARRDVVDDALHLAAGLDLDGNDVAAVAQGDDGLLDGRPQVGRDDKLLELGVEAVVDGAQVAADDARASGWRCRRPRRAA